MGVETAFLLTTQKGGKALGRSDIDILRVGANIDLINIDTKKRPGLWAIRNSIAAVILKVDGAADIEDVMLQGRWLEPYYELVSPLVGLEDHNTLKLLTKFEINLSEVRSGLRKSGRVTDPSFSRPNNRACLMLCDMADARVLT